MKTLSTPLPVFTGIAGIGILSVMDAVIKELTAGHPVPQVVLLRFLAGTLFLAAWALATRAAPPTRGGVKRAAVRGLAMLATSLLFYKTLALLPLAEAVAITFVSPFMMLIVARVMLGEPVTRRALAAIGVGFTGVLVMLAGNFGEGTAGGDPLGYATALGAAFTYALAMVLTRRDSGKDPVVALVLSQNVAILLFSAPLGIAVWTPPGTYEVWLFLLAGLLGTAGHLVLAWSYANAPAARMAPLEYSAFLWAAGLGFVVFDEVPTAATVAGAALIVGACVMTARRAPAAA